MTTVPLAVADFGSIPFDYRIWLLFLSLLVIPIEFVSSLAASSSVRVWDDCISSSIATACHKVAVKSGLNHKVVPLTGDSTTVLEQTLQSIVQELLTEQQDGSKAQLYIEYWCRQEWRHIEAHADVDERLYQGDSSQLRYPDFGHVLYLNVGDSVKGPTCIFQDCQSGGDLVQQPKNDTLSSDDNEVQLHTVPAVAGRLLQFPGSWLHVVPRPTDLWFLPFVQGAPDYDSPEYRRSVILFNLWSKQPPKDVPVQEQNSNHKDEYDDSACNPRRIWKSVPLISHNDQDCTHKTKLWLLGDEPRRQHPMRTVHLHSDKKLLSDALFQVHTPSSVTVKKQQGL